MKYDPNYGNFPIYENDDGERFFGPRMARAIVIRQFEDKERDFWWDLACSFEELELNFPSALEEALQYLGGWIAEIGESRRAQRKPMGKQGFFRWNEKRAC